MAQSGLLGGQDTNGAAVDGSQRGDDVLAVACVQLHSAALIGQSGDRVSRGVLDEVKSLGGSGKVEQRRTGQIVGGQQGDDGGGLLGGGNGVRSGNGGDTGLGGKRGRAGVCNLVLSVERSVQEQLGILCHDTDVRGSGVDGVGTGAGTGDNGDLRHNAGNARDLCGQAGVGVEQIKTALKLGTRGIIERNNRCAGLGGHLQHADILFNILHADGRTVLKHDVGVLAVCTAVSSTHCAVGKQRRVGAVIKKCCKDLCLAGLICCHTVSSYGKADCFL